jgi:GH24 family phage-related lysozyme (muramidase)
MIQTHTVDYSTEVFNFIVGAEGFRNGEPYFDSVNLATIGYGIAAGRLKGSGGLKGLKGSGG